MDDKEFKIASRDYTDLVDVAREFNSKYMELSGTPLPEDMAMFGGLLVMMRRMKEENKEE